MIKRVLKSIFSMCKTIATERHLCTNTFTGIFSWVLTLGGWSIQVYPGVSGLPGVSRFTPDTPGLKASTAIFWVRGV
jgi:hypothetical protein